MIFKPRRVYSKLQIALTNRSVRIGTRKNRSLPHLHLSTVVYTILTTKKAAFLKLRALVSRKTFGGTSIERFKMHADLRFECDSSSGKDNTPRTKLSLEKGTPRNQL
jgi:hypothetical protein